MKRARVSKEQIVSAIWQAERGTPVGDLCRQLGVSDATFYSWKKQYAHRGVSNLSRLRQVEEANNRLKRLVADLSLDKHRRSEALRKTVYGPHAVENWPPGFTRRFRSVACGPVGWRSSIEPRGIDAIGPRISRRSGCASGILPILGRGLGICGSGCSCGVKAGW